MLMLPDGVLAAETDISFPLQDPFACLKTVL